METFVSFDDRRGRTMGGGALRSLGAVAFMVFALVSVVVAAPLNGIRYDVTLPDSTSVPVLLWGDEFYFDRETPDGYTLIYDEVGWLYYADLNADSSEYVSTGVRYTVGSRAPGVPKGLRLNGEVVAKKHQYWRERIGHDSFLEQAAKAASERRRKADALRRSAVDGANAAAGSQAEKVVGLLIVVDFPDQRTSVTRQQLQDFCNRRGGVNGNSPAGSVYDYFYDVSGGLMEYTTVVTPVITLPNPRSHYDKTGGMGNQNMIELLTHTLTRLREMNFDFSQVTTETVGGRQVMSYVNILHAGNRDERKGQDSPIWPHSQSWGSVQTIGGVNIIRYQIADLGVRNTPPPIGIYVHENGHMLMGWRDLYAYDNNPMRRPEMIRRYCVMASNDTTNPQMVNPYFRDLAGWANVVDITNANAVLTHTANSNTVYKYTRNAQESYYIEARARTGRSASLPGAGLFIWQVYRSGDNTGRTTAAYPMVKLIQAHVPNSTSEPFIAMINNAAHANAPFRSGNNTTFSRTSSPPARYFDGTLSDISISSISAAGATMTFTVGTGGAAQPVITAQPAGGTIMVGTPYTLSVSAAVTGGGTLSYQWYRNATASATGGTAISGATGASYTLNTASASDFYYYVIVTNTSGGTTARVTSNVVRVEVQARQDAAAPVVTVQPVGGTVMAGGEAPSLIVQASVSDGGTLSYQWYRNTTASNTGGTVIAGATEMLYTPSVAAEGTVYYYAVVTNTNTKVSGDQTVSAVSQVAAVEVLSASMFRIVTVEMWDKFADGWDFNAALRISVNGADLSPTFKIPIIGTDRDRVVRTFPALIGGKVDVYWVNGGEFNFDSECAFAVYYSDAIPNPSFNPAAGATNDAVAILVSRQYDGLAATPTDELLGTFTVTPPSVNAASPVITAQPAGGTVEVGGVAPTLTVSATVSGGGTLSYQWYRNTAASNVGGTAIAGATGVSYVPSVAATGTFYYYAVVTNTDNGASGEKTASRVSDFATVVVLGAVTHRDVTIEMWDAFGDGWDGNAALRVRVNGTDIEDTPKVPIGEDSRTHVYTFSAVIGGEVEIYWISGMAQGENAFAVYYADAPPNPSFDPGKNAVNDNSVILMFRRYDGLTLTPNGELLGSFTVTAPPADAAPPVITAHPIGGTVEVGGTAPVLTVSATVSGVGALGYQWYRNTTASNVGGTAIAGATGASYTPSVAELGTFYYYAVVTNTSGGSAASRASNAATVIVMASVTSREITVEMWDMSADGWDFNAALRISVNGADRSPNPTIPIIGSNRQTVSYTFTADVGDDVDVYWVSGSNPVYNSECAFAVYYADAPPEPAFNPEVGNTIDNEAIMLWRQYGGLAATPNGELLGSFTVTIPSNDAAAPVIISQPASGTAVVGGEAPILTVAARVIGGGTLSYQWYGNLTASNEGGTAIDGATGVAYTPSVAEEGTFHYYVVVTNTNSSAPGNKTASRASNVATLGVGPVSRSRDITIEMWDASGDGWDFAAALRVSVNGLDLAVTPKIPVGANRRTSVYTFTATVGDDIEIYWISGGAFNFDEECAFAVYYADAPPNPSYNPAAGALNDNGAILLSKQYGSLDAVATGTPLGSFTVVGPVSVLTNDDRTIPPSQEEVTVVIPPANQTPNELTLGPNPVSKSVGVVTLFRSGSRLDNGTLTIYDALGNVVGRINVRDSAPVGDRSRREVGSWDLKDAGGRVVVNGAYLVRGTINTVDGKREKVSFVVGVRL